MVYADGLQEQGDPRGALIALQQPTPSATPGRRAVDESELLRDERCKLLGDKLAAITVDGRRSVCGTQRWSWRLGFIAEASLQKHAGSLFPLPANVRLLLDSPAAVLLEALTLRGLRRAESYDKALSELFSRDTSTLRQLVVGAPEEAQEPAAQATLGSLDGLALQLPRLHTLALTGRGLRLQRPLSHPALRVLLLRQPLVAPQVGRCIGGSELPALEALDLRWPRLSLDPAGLCWLPLAGAPRLALLRLGVRLDATALRALLVHPRLATLSSLDLEACELAADAWRVLDEHAEALAQLRQLRLPASIDGAHLPRLRASCAGLVTPRSERDPFLALHSSCSDDDEQQDDQLPLFR